MLRKLLFGNTISPSSDPQASSRAHDAAAKAQIDALHRAQAVIRFALDGTILDANENFLNTTGYSLSEIQGKHHSIFVDPEYARSASYREFWARLRQGQLDRAEYKRFGKHGQEIWLLASYNPVLDENGTPIEIIKFATDITAEKLKAFEVQGQMDSVHRVQGVIEFDMDGKILTANSVFLDLMGYTLEEVRGKHHSIFVDPETAASNHYRDFWRSLRAGNPDARVFKRITRNGSPVWIQASYNPIRDWNGRPFKVVKFASDITDIITQTQSTQYTAHSVATATEEMSCSIAEISRHMELSRTATDQIAATSTQSGEEAAQLRDSMRSMEKIVQLIQDISGRVNMLALNATIEAARAGEAGRGFSVVANEVKNLSQQTAKATSEISSEISSVQAISERVASSILQTVAGLNQMKQSVASVATTMEEQTSVTREISGHASQLVASVEGLLQQVQSGNSRNRSSERSHTTQAA